MPLFTPFHPRLGNPEAGCEWSATGKDKKGNILKSDRARAICRVADLQVVPEIDPVRFGQSSLITAKRRPKITTAESIKLDPRPWRRHHDWLLVSEMHEPPPLLASGQTQTIPCIYYMLQV
ncbi:hypothetical protein J6590_032820 [Homalodisca vitripennis]|nr:hypothetical protein J6590_032820 [Homalodisca vitripennis]